MDKEIDEAEPIDFSKLTKDELEEREKDLMGKRFDKLANIDRIIKEKIFNEDEVELSNSEV